MEYRIYIYAYMYIERDYIGIIFRYSLLTTGKSEHIAEPKV